MFVKATGLNKRERHLAKLCESSFLSLWSYPNLFYIKKGICKEVSDILVVCDDIVIIFSDKNSKFSNNDELIINWKRWYKRTIVKGMTAINTAEKLIVNEQTMFLDSKCSVKIPITINPKSKIYRILVATGSQFQCKKYLDDRFGSLKTDTNIDGDAEPFVIGDIKSKDNLVHVLDEFTLDLLLSELDTITDFTDYLNKKEILYSVGHHLRCNGEEDLLGLYLWNISENDEHDFILNGKTIASLQPTYIDVEKGIWLKIKQQPGFQQKKEAEKISYFWDKIVNEFANNILKGEIIKPDYLELGETEKVIRYMARETRFHRRILSETIHDAVKRSPGKDQRFTRIILPQSKRSATNTPYVWLLYPQANKKDPIELKNNRDERVYYLYAYCMKFMEEHHKQYPRVVGVATTYPDNDLGLYSEDAILIDSDNWTPEKSVKAQKIASELGIMKSSNLRWSQVGADEYPTEFPSKGMLKQEKAKQRRKYLKRKKKRKKRS